MKYKIPQHKKTQSGSATNIYNVRCNYYKHVITAYCINNADVKRRCSLER